MQEESLILDIEAIEEAIKKKDVTSFKKLAEELHYADLATIYEDLDDEGRSFFTEHIDLSIFPDILAELPDTLIEETLERFDVKDQQKILERMLDDDRADILQDVSPEARQRYLELLQPEDEEATRSLMRYDEDTAGGRMTTHVAKVTQDMTVKEVLDLLRDDQESTESLARIYVVDSEGRLVGKVRLRHLAFSSWDTPISEIVQDVDMKILATADQEEAAQMFAKYDMTVLPVVDEYGRLLGIITHDDILEILEQESTEDIEKMSGIVGDPSEESYLNTPITTHFKRRFPWLISLALLSICSGYIMFRFQNVLSSIFLLALYLPMVIAAGGNTGGQAATMVIRAMTLGELESGETSKVVYKELFLGLMLGLVMAICIGCITIFILPGFLKPEFPAHITLVRFAFSVSLALAIQITIYFSWCNASYRSEDY